MMNLKKIAIVFLLMGVVLSCKKDPKQNENNQTEEEQKVESDADQAAA